MISKIFINFFPRKNWTRILSHILSKYVVVNVWWVATNASFTSFNLQFTLGNFFALGPLDPHIVPHMSKYVVVNVWWVATNAWFTSFNLRFTLGHFFALGPLTFPNLNISTIWVRDPWVSISNQLLGVPPIYM